MSEASDPRPMQPTPGDRVDELAFGAALKRLRDLAGKSPKVLADAVENRAPKLKIHPNTIRTWFAGTIVSENNEKSFLIVLDELGIVSEADRQVWLEAAKDLRAGRRRPNNDDLPYRSLDSYDTTDADFFHGRKELIRSVMDQVDAVCAANGGAVALTGASGTGKSSLLKAGLIPKLRPRADSGTTYMVLFIEAGADPVSKLAQEISAKLHVDTNKVLPKLAGGPDAVAELVEQLKAHHLTETPRGKLE